MIPTVHREQHEEQESGLAFMLLRKKHSKVWKKMASLDPDPSLVTAYKEVYENWLEALLKVK
jgi:hypothetical protein